MTTHPAQCALDADPDVIRFVDLWRQHEPLADELSAAFARVMRAGSFILGEEVEQFEAEFAAYCGVRHCVGVASGTAALTIMLRAAGIRPGDEVIVPAMTFIATALAVIHAGASPVAVDVEPDTGLIDPDAVDAAIGPATAAILAVHLYGQTCDMDRLARSAQRHGLLVLEDAAQAHGATYRGARAGSLGVAGAFSFYPSKNLGAFGDGGAICTGDGSLAEKARRYRDLGRGGDGGHVLTGYNERLDGLQASVLRVKLPRLDAWNATRRELASAYQAQLIDEPSVELLTERPVSGCVYHVFPVRVAERERVATELGAAGVAVGLHYSRALPDHSALRGMHATDVPIARDWAGRTLSLPLFPGMTAGEIESVSSVVRRAVVGPSVTDRIVRGACGAW